MCVNDTHLPEEQRDQRQQQKSTSAAPYDNGQGDERVVFQEDKSNLQQNRGQLSM